VIRAKLVLPEPERCVFCDRFAEEWHHPAGRNHYAWYVVALCIYHHRLVTQAENQSGVVRAFTSDIAERKRLARLQCLVFLALLDSIPEDR